MNTEIIGLVFSREKCLERSLENLSQEKTKLYKIIDNAMNTEIIGLDESEALPGCCTVELIQQKQHLLDQSQIKLKQNYIENIRIQRIKTDLRKARTDTIKNIVEMEIKIVNYKTELKKF